MTAKTKTATATKTSKRVILAPRTGSKKAKVFERFASKGPAAAVKYGRSVALKTTTLASWFSTWRNSTVKARPMKAAA